MDAPVLGGLGGEVELAEEASDVCFDGLRGDVELLGDATVGASLGNERQHFAFSWRELGERVAGGGGGEELGDERRFDDGAAAGDYFEGGDEVVDVGDAVFEQVADTLGRIR